MRSVPRLRSELGQIFGSTDTLLQLSVEEIQSCNTFFSSTTIVNNCFTVLASALLSAVDSFTMSSGKILG